MICSGGCLGFFIDTAAVTCMPALRHKLSLEGLIKSGLIDEDVLHRLLKCWYELYETEGTL
ncbi:hypothetical protein PEB0149_010820 [Bartonella apis]|uniref:Uncharacterized protein n=1 Tax=Bartonella apis TaxID=1686310 RepID=A0A1R0F9S9_9HYPH|nr:hypothetical protein PEB0149_010820 [Bartonella apis]